MNISRHPVRAFTLIEMMVAVSIFAIVMLVGTGALLSLVEANSRAQAINSVINNLNAAVEDMSRTLRVGSVYHCETSSTPPPATTLATAKDCASGGGLLLAFESSTGDTNDVNDQVVYRLNGTQLERSLASGANGTFVSMTAPEVTIEEMSFYVIGAARGDGIQPRVLMHIKGSAKVPGGTTTFNVQASVVQRLLDI
jgi:prepilin-type N-terminal cleavage/methylation domain-containing protein